jgi:hypothetical protein
MRKSKDITKYNADWQIVRSSIKGSKFSLEEKLSKVKKYFDYNRSEDRWERCVNWCEGLIMGYKASKNLDAIDRIIKEIDSYDDRSLYNKEDSNVNNNTLLREYSYDERLVLWKDMYRTNTKWLKKGYYHKECNEFMDDMVNIFMKNREDIWRFDILLEIREESKNLENTHKFFF